VWRGGDVTNTNERPAVVHGSRRGFKFHARYLSAVITLLMLGLLAMFAFTNVFYVQSIAVGGLQTLSKEEVFALTDTANQHIFWINPVTVRANLMRSPTIADARVEVGWAAPMVRVLVQEREPAVVWQQAGTAVWVDVLGQVMQQREDRPNLLRVTYEGLASSPLGPNDRINPDVVQGALQLQTLLGDRALRYSEYYGLGFRDERGWDAWFGTGTDMPNRIAIYNALVQNLLGRGIQPTVVSVANPDAVYYSVTFAP
jgi:hypothetical protein